MKPWMPALVPIDDGRHAAPMKQWQRRVVMTLLILLLLAAAWILWAATHPASICFPNYDGRNLPGDPCYEPPA